jgi:ABC-type transporter Mla MlaB component
MAPGGAEVALSGPATVYEASRLREALGTALAGAAAGTVRVDLASAGPWDVAGLQLLVSAVATVRASGRSVTFVGVPAACREAAGRAGLGRWLDEVSETQAEPEEARGQP